MKNENGNRISFTVRLNLHKPRHREAWEKLCNDPQSRTEVVVNALTDDHSPPTAASPILTDEERLKGLMKEVVKDAVTEALRDLSVAGLPVSSVSTVSVPAESEVVTEISDDDYEIAEDFLSALGC